MTFWIILILVVAALLILGVERLMCRLGIHPVHPEETRTGAAQLAGGVERWAERRTRQARSRATTTDDETAVEDSPPQRDAQNS